MTTISPTIASFGTYYYISGNIAGGVTIASLPQPSANSNIGKYWTIRNSSTSGDTTLTVTYASGASGFTTAQTTLYSNTSITVVAYNTTQYIFF